MSLGEWCREVLLASANGQPSKTAGQPDFAIFERVGIENACREGFDQRSRPIADPNNRGFPATFKLVKLRHNRENG